VNQYTSLVNWKQQTGAAVNLSVKHNYHCDHNFCIVCRYTVSRTDLKNCYMAPDDVAISFHLSTHTETDRQKDRSCPRHRAVLHTTPSKIEHKRLRNLSLCFTMQLFWAPPSQALLLIVGFQFNPSTGIFTQQVLANLVVDEYSNGERQRCQPPSPPGNQHNNNNCNTICLIDDERSAA